MVDFPNVPDVPGVPPLLRDPFASLANLELPNLSSLVQLAVGLIGPQWGLFYFGLPVVIADTVLDLTFKKDWSVADFTIESGGFESYDKVELPFNSTIRFSSGGGAFKRQLLLDSIATIAGNTLQYALVMPEAIYTSVTIEDYSFHRAAAQGLGLMVVDVRVKQVRIGTAAAFTSTKSPAGADPINGGTVQTTPVSSALNGSIIGGGFQ